MLLPLIFGVLAIAALAMLSYRRSGKRLLVRLRAEWARPRRRERDIEAIADFYRSHSQGGAALDDRTWNDLLLDDVFAYLDRNESTVGQQMLYARLRSLPHRLDEFEALVSCMSTDADRRERSQVALARLNDRSGYYLHRLTQPDALEWKSWHAVFPLWSLTVLAVLALAAFWPKLLFIAIVAFAANFPVRFAMAHRISREVSWFRQVGPLLSAANALVTANAVEAAGLASSLKADLNHLQKLGATARWVNWDPQTTNDITLTLMGYLVLALMEYVNILLLMDVNALYLAARELHANRHHLLRVIQAVGEIDAAIAVASFRAGARQWTKPLFAEPGAPAVFTNLSHPLVENAVPNSLALAPPHGLLVTGSNMSGKSTLLRTVGVNVVLAQTIHTCLAETYRAPVYEVRSCIGRADDLLSGKSYYLVEVESVLALVRASESSTPNLFILDELFRGTNAVERIAAAEAVLRALIGGERPNVALAATHDGELVDLLDDSYAVCHFADAVGTEGLTFTYRMMPGPATSRNAISLLRLNGAPESVVNQALARAAELDRLRRKTVAF
jgi:hypothetical protein